MTVKIKMNHAGMEALLRSEGVANKLLSVASQVSSSQPGSYSVKSEQQKSRVVAKIETADPKTYYSNLKHNHLAKMVK